MIKTMINAWKVPDIRKKLLFTAFIILVFRIGSVIPVPFLNIVDEINVGKGNTILTYLSLMTGSAFTYGIFSLCQSLRTSTLQSSFNFSQWQSRHSRDYRRKAKKAERSLLLLLVS